MVLSCVDNGRYVVLKNQDGKGEKVFISWTLLVYRKSKWSSKYLGYFFGESEVLIIFAASYHDICNKENPKEIYVIAYNCINTKKIKGSIKQGHMVFDLSQMCSIGNISFDHDDWMQCYKLEMNVLWSV